MARAHEDTGGAFGDTPTTRSSRRGKLLRTVRAVGVGTGGGLLAGGIVGGLPARLIMRIIALTADPALRGTSTANGNVVGRFTEKGSIALLLSTAVFLGIGPGLLYVALRPWLAALGRWRGVAFGTLLLTGFGYVVVDYKNADFDRFGVPILNIVLFATLPLLFGIAVVPVTDWLDRVLPRNIRPLHPLLPALAGRLALGVFIVAGLLTLGTVAAFLPSDIASGQLTPDLLLVTYLYIAGPLLAMRARRRAALRAELPATQHLSATSVRAAVPFDYVLLAWPFVVGLVYTARSVLRILAAAS